MSNTPARPNLMLITTDQQRWDGLGITGDGVLQTPHLDELAAAGALFPNAYSTTPSCIAARRTILTGQHAATHGLPGYQDGQEFFPEFTLPGLLGQAGYHTQLVGKLHQYPQRKRYGFDDVVLSDMLDGFPDSRWFGQNDYLEWLRQAVGADVDPNLHGVACNSRIARPFHMAEQYHHSAWVAREAKRFLLRRRDPSAPWFLHVSFWAPHPPLVPPQPYWDRYIGADIPPPPIGEWAPNWPAAPGLHTESAAGPFDAQEIRRARVGYYGLITHIDDCVASILKDLYAPGSQRLDDPLWILFASDHGELLGDHHLFRKVLPYQGSTAIPFFISGRNVPLASARHQCLACLEDILPTLLDLAGVPIPGNVDGRSLAALARGGAMPTRDVLYGEHRSGRMSNHWVRTMRHKYCWFAETGEEQLFDLEADPGEMRDLSGDAELLAPMRDLLEARLTGRADCAYRRAALRPACNRPPSAIWPDG